MESHELFKDVDAVFFSQEETVQDQLLGRDFFFWFYFSNYIKPGNILSCTVHNFKLTKLLSINIMKYFLLIFLTYPLTGQAGKSICYGTTANGHLEYGVKIPSRGKNYVGYSKFARLAGRTYVHATVKTIIVLAYKELENEQPGKVYKYAETGFRKGGQFKPHKTHRNGLSVDFMTPVIDKEGRSVHLPTHALNRYGYNIEFDQNNEFRGMRIDYESLAAHIVALHKNAKKLGYDFQRVIFDPELRAYLYKTKYARYLRKNIRFSKKRSWVRHDEHYHVDFSIPCK